MEIIINPDTHEAEFFDKPEYEVGTSLKNNPAIDTETIPDVTIYSIFHKNDAIQQDGMPLIWALKEGGSREHG